MRTKVEAPVSERIQDPPKSWSFLIDSLFVLLIWYLKYSGVPFHWRRFPTNTISISVQCSVSHSVNPLLSLSTLLTPYSVFTCCCHFDKNTLMILYALSLNKLDWSNKVFHSVVCSQYNDTQPNSKKSNSQHNNKRIQSLSWLSLGHKNWIKWETLYNAALSPSTWLGCQLKSVANFIK